MHVSNEQLDRVTDLLATLATANERERETWVSEHREAYLRLLMGVGHFLSETCGNMNKLHEKTTQLTLQINNTDPRVTVLHIKDHYGPDLQVVVADDDDVDIAAAEHTAAVARPQPRRVSDIEDKTSTTTLAKKRKANWNFVVHPTLAAVQSAAALVAYIRTQFAGRIMFNAILGAQTTHSYDVSGLFCALYFAHVMWSEWNGTVPLNERRKKPFNLGSSYCARHNTYHRMEKYRRFDALLQSRVVSADDPLAVFSPDEWEGIDARCVCPPQPARQAYLPLPVIVHT